VNYPHLNIHSTEAGQAGMLYSFTGAYFMVGHLAWHLGCNTDVLVINLNNLNTVVVELIVSQV
jgi:hypothetical protein